MNDRHRGIMADIDAARHAIDGEMDCRTAEYRALDSLCRAVATMAEEPEVVPKKEDGPVAIDLGIQHCGRKLFFVAERDGVWCSHRDYNEPDAERLSAVIEKPCRGRGREKTLYRLNSLSTQLAKLFGKDGTP